MRLLLVMVVVGRAAWRNGLGGRCVRRRLAFAKALVLRQRCNGRECLTALVTLDLQAASDVHALVAAQIGELRIRFKANLRTLSSLMNDGVDDVE